MFDVGQFLSHINFNRRAGLNEKDDRLPVLNASL